MNDSIVSFIAGVLCGTVLGIVMSFFAIFNSDYRSNLRLMIEECEAELPRSQTCKLYAHKEKEK